MEDLGHLVPALAAADVDHDVGVAVFREGLLDHRLPGAEPAGHGHGPALGHGKEHVENALSREEGPRAVEARPRRPRAPDRPLLHHGDRIAVAQVDHRLVNGHLAVPYALHRARAAGRHHHPQLESGAFVDRAEHVAGVDPIANGARRREAIPPRAIERRGGGAGLDEVAGDLGELSKRPADAVDHAAEQSGPELDRQRQAVAGHGLAHPQTRRFLEDLERREIAADAKHLGQQVPVADVHQLVQRDAAKAGGLGHRPHDACQRAAGHRGLTR